MREKIQDCVVDCHGCGVQCLAGRLSYVVSVSPLLNDNYRIANEFFKEINLNAGIVSNKGFIRQMASPGTTIIQGKYISAWGGIQSTGQTLGQIVRN
jgi:hypothetical protein